MNIELLKEKEDVLEKAQEDYDLEFSKWVNRAKEIATWLSCFLKNKSIENSHLFQFSYISSDTVSLNITTSLVCISIRDFENDFMGSISIPVDVFIGSDWENYVIDYVNNFIANKIQKQNEKQKEKDLKELERLQTLYK